MIFTLDYDGDYTGVWADLPHVFGGVTNYMPVYVNSSGDVAEADAAIPVQYPAIGLKVAAAGVLFSTILLQGAVRNDAWVWTPGAQLFLDSGGGLASVAPGGGIVQVVGVAMASNIIYVNPVLAYV